jgi:Xaa-Pro aminopeptidase
MEPADEILERMRVVKSPAEIEMMRHASAVSVEVMNAMLEAVAVGRTDGDLAAIGFRVATARGGTPWDFGMASGPHSKHMWWSRLPAFDTARPYAAGDLVHPDVYGCVNGYFYDFVRSTVVGGEPTAEQRGCSRRRSRWPSS